MTAANKAYLDRSAGTGCGSWKCGIEAGRRAGKIWRSDHGDCTEHFGRDTEAGGFTENPSD